MRIDEAFYARVKAIELRSSTRANLLDRRQLVNPLTMTENRNQQIVVLRLFGNDAPSREIERVDDLVRRLTRKLIKNHVCVVESPHLQHPGVRGLDCLLGDFDAVLPLASMPPQCGELVDTA